MKVLLVEDSATVAHYVSAILRAAPDIELLPVAATAEEGARLAVAERPSVVLMDMMLPDRDGIWAIEEIMAEAPCPIVVLSGYLDRKDRDITFESLRAGAVDVLAKPSGLSVKDREHFSASLLRTVRLMATAVVVRRRRRSSAGGSGPPLTGQAGDEVLSERQLRGVERVLIGASTGGPALLYRLLSDLPSPLPFPLLLGQHTLVGFDESLASWLSATGHLVSVAATGERVRPGRVYITPAGRALRIQGQDMMVTIDEPTVGPLSYIDTLFESAAAAWAGSCLGVLLTGMGSDGARGLLSLRKAGSLTVAQSHDSCVVTSMPDSARALDAVQHSLAPAAISQVLLRLVRSIDRSSRAQAREGG